MKKIEFSFLFLFFLDNKIVLMYPKKMFKINKYLNKKFKIPMIHLGSVHYTMNEM